MRGCKSHISKASFLPVLSFLLPPPTVPADTTSRRFASPLGFLTVLHCSFPWKTSYPLISSLGEGAGTQIRLPLVWLALTSHLPWILVSLGHPAQAWLPLNPSQPHPGFRWRHRPGSGLPFPLWASGPQLSLVSDFIASLIVASSKSPSSICAWHRPGTSARAAAIGHGLRGGGSGCWARCSMARGRGE